MIVYFSTVVRSAPQRHGGELVKLDWAKKQVVAKVPIFPANPTVDDPNPRGSTRGGRGILVTQKEVFVASYHSILVFDQNLQLLKQISNPLFANLHEIAWEGENIWATSTDIDAAVKVDQSGRTIDSWWPREDSVIADRYALQPLEINKMRDNRTSFVGVSSVAPSHVHLNAVAMQNDRPLLLLNRFGSVGRLRPTEVLIENTELRGCHNVLVTPEGFVLINDTVGRALYVYDSTGRLYKRILLTKFFPVRRLLYRHALASVGSWLAANGRPTRLFHASFHKTATARPIFVRGLCLTDKQSILIGISPAAVLEIDWRAEKLLDMYMYSSNRHVCVHGLAWCPSPI
jgi:hypothetical protein